MGLSWPLSQYRILYNTRPIPRNYCIQLNKRSKKEKVNCGDMFTFTRIEPHVKSPIKPRYWMAFHAEGWAVRLNYLKFFELIARWISFPCDWEIFLRVIRWERNDTIVHNSYNFPSALQSQRTNCKSVNKMWVLGNITYEINERYYTLNWIGINIRIVVGFIKAERACKSSFWIVCTNNPFFQYC